MTITVDQFRDDFPAFADTSRWGDDVITLYLNLANATLDPARWCDFLDYGTELFIAHNIVLDEQDNSVARRGGIPGSSGVGVITSKSVGPGSVSYDISAGSEDNGGIYNLTVYGRRFLRLARMVGAGPIQVTN